MTGPLEAFAEFFGIDPDLVQAATEQPAVAMPSAMPANAVNEIIWKMPDPEKTAILSRLFDGDPHVAMELRAKVRDRMAVTAAPLVAARTVGELRTRALAIGITREQVSAAKVAAELERQTQEAEKARQARLLAIARRGEGVWREVESEIERRNAGAYDTAASLLMDLRAVAEERGAMPDFEKRLWAIRDRHARKERFIDRLAKI